MSEQSPYELKELPQWVNNRDVKVPQSARYDEAPFYYSLVDYQENLSESGFRTFSRTYQCLQDSSRIENASQILTELHAGYQRLEIHWIRVFRNGELIDALDNENISVLQRERSLESHIVDNRLTISISIDDLRVGDHIDFASTIVEERGDHPLMGRTFSSNYWLNWSCLVHQQYIRVVNNSGNDLKARRCIFQHGEERSESEIIKHGQDWSELFEDLEIGRIPNTTPAWLWGNHVQISTDQDWPQISRYLYEFYEQSAVHEETGLEGCFEELNIASNPADLEKDCLKVIRFVQDQIRYRGESHGIFTHTPKSPSKTYRKRSGDCKDKSNLMVLLLRKLGIESSLVLVSTNNGAKQPELNPSAYNFNHMVVQFEIAGNSYFVDPTIQKQGGNLESMARLDYGWGLPIKQAGSELVSIKASLSKRVFTLRHLLNFSSDKPSLTINRIYEQHRADNMRSYFSATEKKHYQTNFLEWAQSGTGLELELREPVSVVEDDNEKNILKTTEIYDIKNFSKTHGEKRIEIPADFIGDIPVANSDEYPTRVDLDGEIEHEIIVEYKLAPELDSGKFELESAGFTYADQVRPMGDKYLNYWRLITPKTKFVAAGEELSKYRADVDRLVQRSNYLITHQSRNRFKSLATKMLTSFLFWYFVIIVAITVIRS